MTKEQPADKELVVSFFDEQPQPAFWTTPVFDDSQQIIDFEYSYCNREFYSYTGLSEKQLLRTRLSNSLAVTDSNIRRKILEELSHIYREGGCMQDRLYNPALKKYYSYVRNRIQGGVLTILQDRTEEYRMMSQLEEQKNLLNNILQHSSNGISVTEAIRNEKGEVIDARTVLANDAAVKFTGLPREIYLSKTAVEIDPNIIDSPYYQLYVNTLNTGEPAVLQYRLEMTGRWLELTISRMDRDHIFHIFTDVTPIKEAQLQLEKSIEELKRSNEYLEEFAHAASHDLKEPIRKVRTFADRLRYSLGPKMEEQEKSLFDRMEKSTERMQLLVEDLLEFSHVSQNPQQMEKVDLNEKIQRVLSDLELPIEEKKAVISVGPLPTISGYRRQLQQLFQNLVGNALKYSKQGIPPHVDITSRTVTGNEVPVNLPAADFEKRFHLIEVSDNGIGFEKAYAERIFEMFQRLHARSEYSGTGLGLSIARKVVQNHQGYIWADSEPGVGSRFYVLFPEQKETNLASL